MEQLITDLRSHFESFSGQGLTLDETKSSVETLLRTMLAAERIYDYAVASPNATQLDVAVKPTSEEHFVYIPIRIE